MIFTARLAVTVDVEYDTSDVHTAPSDAERIGLGLRSLIDGSVLPGPGTPVVWVASIDIGEPVAYKAVGR